MAVPALRSKEGCPCVGLGLHVPGTCPSTIRLDKVSVHAFSGWTVDGLDGFSWKVIGDDQYLDLTSLLADGARRAAPVDAAVIARPASIEGFISCLFVFLYDETFYFLIFS